MLTLEKASLRASCGLCERTEAVPGETFRRAFEILAGRGWELMSGHGIRCPQHAEQEKENTK